MPAQIKSPLNAKNRTATGAALATVLADLVDLSLVGKQAHWNLVGRRFRSIHLQLDEIVDAARLASDDVAERSAAIGVPPDGRAATVAKESGLPGHPEGWAADDAVVAYFVDALSRLIERLRAQIDAVETTDVVSQDLLIGIAAIMEKHYWMLQAEQ